MFADGRRLILAGSALVLVFALAVPAVAQQTKPPAKPAVPRTAPKAAPRPATAPRPAPKAAPAQPAAPRPAVAAPKAAAPVASAYGKIQGRVTARGEPVPFANVIIQGSKQGTQADDNGNFVIVGVPVGEVSVRAMATGYDAQVQKVQVNAGATATLNFAFGEQKVVKELDDHRGPRARSASTRSPRPPSRPSPRTSSRRSRWTTCARRWR